MKEMRIKEMSCCLYGRDVCMYISGKERREISTNDSALQTPTLEKEPTSSNLSSGSMGYLDRMKKQMHA